MQKLSRRDFGKLAAYLGTLSVAGFCGVRNWPAPPAARRIGEVEASANDPAWRVLNRVAFGPCPGDLERVSEMGVHAYIDEQLAPEAIEESPLLKRRFVDFETLNLDASEARDLENAERADEVISPVFRTLLQLPNPSLALGPGQTSCELQQACVLRAVYSTRQLQEVMVEFWSDHFNIDQGKGDCAWLKTVDDRAIRRHALGKFRDLLWASAQSPAMLYFLDNTQNFQSEQPGGPASNENYARELLELHTLGVEGGYTLHDIQEVARCFTGWGVKTGLGCWPGEFTFDQDGHDTGPKTVLGRPLTAGRAQEEGFELLDRLSRHPSTALFIARKLCCRFISDQPPPELVTQIANVFRSTDGDIRQVIAALLHSPAFLEQGGLKLKRPFDYVASAVRALAAETTGEGLLPELELMGQAPFRHAAPDSYPDHVDAWKQGVMARWNFAVRFAAGELRATQFSVPSLLEAIGETEPRAICRKLSRFILGRSLPEAQLEALAGLATEVGDMDQACRQWTALLLSAPQFQWR